MERGCKKPVSGGKAGTLPYRHSLCGFSLIEVLVVVAIIALLLSIVVPALERAQIRVRNVTCQSNLRQWGLLFVMYTEDNGGSFPDSGRTWTDSFKPYQGESDDILCCPLAVVPDAESDTSYGGPLTAYRDCKDASLRQDQITGSYGLNGWVTNVSNDTSIIYGISTRNNWRTRQSVSNSASIPLLLDSLWVVAYPDVTNLPPVQNGDASNCDLSGGGRRQIRHFAFDRHGDGGNNGLFLDMSGRAIGLKELWRLKWHRASDLTAPLPEWPEWMARYPEY
jgi:prepilin-type N-terminal cleavage/methylation domain-containing protein